MVTCGSFPLTVTGGRCFFQGLVELLLRIVVSVPVDEVKVFNSTRVSDCLTRGRPHSTSKEGVGVLGFRV